MDQSSEIFPMQEALREQLKELNNRSRWYSSQLWYIPFAYFGLVALAIGNIGSKEPKFIGTALLYCGIVGIIVFWHMLSIKDGEKRAVQNLQAIEGKLHLNQTAEYKNYPLAFFVGVFIVFVACFLGGVLFFLNSLCCLPK